MKLVIGLAALLLTEIATAQAYRCTQDGKTVYQQAPCDAPGGRAIVTARPSEPSPAQGVSGDVETRRQAERSASVRVAIESRSVVPGMTEAEAIGSWGQPTSVNTDVIGPSRVNKQYVFRWQDTTRYFYTENGVVTAVQDRPALVSAPSQPCLNATEYRNAKVRSVYDTDERRTRELAKLIPC